MRCLRDFADIFAGDLLLGSAILRADLIGCAKRAQLML
jgi:hypothetical protein